MDESTTTSRALARLFFDVKKNQRAEILAWCEDKAVELNGSHGVHHSKSIYLHDIKCYLANME